MFTRFQMQPQLSGCVVLKMFLHKVFSLQVLRMLLYWISCLSIFQMCRGLLLKLFQNKCLFQGQWADRRARVVQSRRSPRYFGSPTPLPDFDNFRPLLKYGDNNLVYSIVLKLTTRVQDHITRHVNRNIRNSIEFRINSGTREYAICHNCSFLFKCSI